MMYARVPDLSLKMRVTCEREVRDWYITIFGMRSVEVPQDDYHGTDVFKTEDEFMLATPDPDCNFKLPWRKWRDWLCGDPPSPPPSPLQTPPPPQDMFLPPVRIVDPEDPEDEGEDEQMF
ncbi:hypothetical protein FRC10_003455 [Ceratobasidium sp. 414]|nr:hypothetical protein FRC10_003455 [Ceratobasidium sp. 414]